MRVPSQEIGCSNNSGTEVDYTGQSTQTHVTTFTYDHRERLIAESRVVNSTTTVYDLEYEYDQLGNRTQKSDNVSGMVTDYVYDVTSAEPGFDTKNSRLRH